MVARYAEADRRDVYQKWAETMGVFPGDITIRKMKGRWGSCNVKTGELCFALDLITKDGACIEGVVVHELNHLLERDIRGGFMT